MQSRAWERLHDPNTLGSMGMRAEQVLELAKDAGYTEAEAQKFASDWAWKRSQNDMPF